MAITHFPRPHRHPAPHFELTPAFVPQLCQQHRLWMAGPAAIQIPLMCHVHPAQFFMPLWGEILAPRQATSDPAAPLSAFKLRYLLLGPALLGDVSGPVTISPYPGTAIALAPALAYAAEAYGPEAVPALLAALAEHDTWETLPPAVFGVSADEFDAGWHAYLVEHYALDKSQ